MVRSDCAIIAKDHYEIFEQIKCIDFGVPLATRKKNIFKQSYAGLSYLLCPSLRLLTQGATLTYICPFCILL